MKLEAMPVLNIRIYQQERLTDSSDLEIRHFVSKQQESHLLRDDTRQKWQELLLHLLQLYVHTLFHVHASSLPLEQNNYRKLL